MKMASNTVTNLAAIGAGSEPRDTIEAAAAMRDAREPRQEPAARGAAAAPRGGTFSPFVPLLIGGLALVLAFGWQTALLLGDRSTLQAAHEGQQQTVDNAGKLRAQLDALAADTQRLADGGNPNARLLVGELQKRGITINPNANANANAAAAAPATPAAPAATK